MGEWATASIRDFFDLDPGYAFKSADFIDAGVPVIKIKNIKAGHFSEHEFSYVSPRFLSLRDNKLAKPGDLLISMSGNRHDGSPHTWVGKIAPFQKAEAFFINQRVGALRRKAGAKIDLRFASFLLSSFPYQELFISIATSSGGRQIYLPNKSSRHRCRTRLWKHKLP
jgi:type I restriction enzyme S subunit